MELKKWFGTKATSQTVLMQKQNWEYWLERGYIIFRLPNSYHLGSDRESIDEGSNHSDTEQSILDIKGYQIYDESVHDEVVILHLNY